MDIEGITLSEISQIDKDKYCMTSLTCGIYKHQTHRKRVEWWFPGTEGGGKWGDTGQRLQTFSYTMNKFWGSKEPHGDYS